MKTIIKYLETKGTITANTFSKNYNPSHPEIIYWYLLHIFVYIINLYVTPYVLFNLVSSCVPWIFFKSEDKFYKAFKIFAYLHMHICIVNYRSLPSFIKPHTYTLKENLTFVCLNYINTNDG